MGTQGLKATNKTDGLRKGDKVMQELAKYLEKYQFEESHLYLLELIPLIEMIWADGRNQEAEIKLLYRFTIEHLSRTSREDSEVGIVSEADLNHFINRFLSKAPDPNMLKDLREACLLKLEKTPSLNQALDSKEAIIDYCMDIAAACVKTYPYKFDERIVKQEKELLTEIVNALSISE